jgi:adenine specific DNA methylase Mod
MANELYFGDNLDVLRRHIKDETIDLVYLDPPFNSKATYNVLYKEPTGRKSAAQVQAFEDTWHWGPDAAAAFDEVVSSGTPAAGIVTALRSFLGENDLMAYLTMMSVRFIELRRVLKPTGSLYLHCDSTASHYLRIVLDAIFGVQNFRNEIIWKRNSAHSDGKQGAQHFGRITDTILFRNIVPTTKPTSIETTGVSTQTGDAIDSTTSKVQVARRRAILSTRSWVSHVTGDTRRKRCSS